MANLLATSHRTGIPAFVEAAPLSSSAEAPRPTYWDSVFRDLHQHGVQTCVPGASTSFAPMKTVTVPETRPVRKVQLDASQPCVYNMIGFFQSDAFFDDFAIIATVIPSALWRHARAHLFRCYSADACHTVALHVRRGDYTRFADIFEQLDVVSYYDVAVRQLLGGFLLHQPGPHAASPLADHLVVPAGGDAHAAAPVSSSSCPPLHLLVFCDEERFGQTVAGFFRAKYGSRGALRVSLVSPAAESSSAAAVPSASSVEASMPREVLELLMMAQCNDVVMANSTFSWWAAYLNRSPLHRVVAPSRWFVKDPYPASNHLYCPGWMLV